MSPQVWPASTLHGVAQVGATVASDPPSVMLPGVAVQMPQFWVTDTPQLFTAVMSPHFGPASVDPAPPSGVEAVQMLVAVQPQTLGWPVTPPHVCGAVQLPHDTVRVAPQLSVLVMVPQLAAA